VIGAVVDSPTKTMFYVDSSSTVSFTINNQTPSPTSAVPEFSSWVILILALMIVSTGLLVYFKKHNKKK
jgi:hypothetical protein